MFGEHFLLGRLQHAIKPPKHGERQNDAGRLCGIELMEDWFERGRRLYPHIEFYCGSGDALPWADHTFDLVHQGMVLSSVPSASLREGIAREMARVVRPGGFVWWYDFFFNPVNRDTVGMTMRAVRTLFPGWTIVDRRRVTLAPPLSRVLDRVWKPGIDLMSRLKIFNTHYLILLRKP